METSATFTDCPAYLDAHGTVRCGLPAEVQYRYTMTSTGGPLESAKIRCPLGHWFNGPIEFLTLEKDTEPDAARGVRGRAGRAAAVRTGWSQPRSTRRG
jgi:hypothetical protein